MISRRNVIFIGGIHGVGKSTLCKKLCNDLGLEYLSASKLIGDYKNELARKNLDDGKSVANINDNQDILVEAVKGIVSLNEKFLMDGHFTLLDSKKAVQPIPLSTFASIMPGALIVLIDDPAAIQGRLLSRDHTDYDLKLLEAMQTQEVKHAEYVGIKLNIKTFHARIDNYDYVKQIATDSLGR